MNHDIALRYNVSFMYLALKSSTPENKNKLFDHIASEGPHLQIQIPSNLEIIPPSETKSAMKRLLNFGEHCIDKADDLFDWLYASKYSP